MDADTVRLILLVVGVILILALYLWERSRDPGGPSDAEDYDEEDAPYSTGKPRRDPELGSYRDSEREPDGRETRPARPPVQTEMALDDDDSPAGDGAPLLIQLSVAKRKGDLRGPEILEVADACGLRPGEMDIFHCLDEFDDGTRIYFSMANMVKPGTFPFDDMEDFSTPGMMLFAQLDGQPEDLTILDEMIATARKLATTMGADVLDDTRRPLTVRKEEEMRKAVLANEARNARLARR